MVWALPLSLAATQGIDVSFSSSGYLDVSVHRVTSCMAIYSPYGTYTLLYVGSPIRTSADQGLFAPPRSLSRLSSALSAKASTLRSYQLDQIDLKAAEIWENGR